jgi:hypothetical protein
MLPAAHVQASEVARSELAINRELKHRDFADV